MQDLRFNSKKVSSICVLFVLAMWSLEDLMKEVDDVVALVATKPNDEVFGNALVKGLCSKLPNIHPRLGAGSALQLIEKTQALPEKLGNLFKGSIEAQLMSKALEEPQSQDLKPQTLLYPQHFLTESEWKQLQDTHATLHDKYQLLRNRLKLLGVTSLAEQTVRSCVALILSTLTQLPAKPEAFEMVQDFKMGFGECNTVAKQPYVRKYPDYPSGLSQEMRGLAYPKEQPLPQEVDRFASLSAYIPLRKSHKALQGHKSSDAQGPSAASGKAQSLDNFMHPAAAAAWMQQVRLCSSMPPWLHMQQPLNINMPRGQPQLEGLHVSHAAQQFNPQASAQAALPLANQQGQLALPAPPLPPLTAGQLRANPSVESMESVEEQGASPRQ